ncbi:MAG: S8 family serine peptidase [Acidobacteria bacterium]|nr:S8 family serine peptidase [Acidobacteriota bacterium]
MKHKTTHKVTRHHRIVRLLAVLALLLTIGVVFWQSNRTMKASSLAAAFESSRVSLDSAVETYKANRTAENWQTVEIARKAYETAFAEAVAVNAINPNPEMASSAALQQQTLVSIKQGLGNNQKKIGSRLFLSLLRATNRLPQELSSLRTSVQTNGDGEAIVDITVTNRTAGLKILDQYQFRIRSAVGNMIRADVPFNRLEELAGNAEIIAIQEALQAATHRLDAPASTAPAPVASKEQIAAAKRTAMRERLKTALAGMAVNVSQGDKTHRAEEARGFFGVNGSGVKIGVLSDGVNSLAAAQASGDLPAVTVLPGQAGSGDEGTAMLEIVHDLAPGAQLFFATAFTSITSFAQNIRDLRTAGCDIIVDDIIYFAESPFQDGQAGSVVAPTNGGVVIQAVKDVTAAGALYFSSAGNEGNVTDGTSGTWEGNFNANGAGTGALAGAGTLHNFGDGGISNLVTASASITTLHWSDPLGASGNDYDIYVLNGALTTVFDASTGVQDGNDDPFEIFGGAFTNERIVVALFSGVQRFIRVENFRGRLQRNTTGATFGHSCAALAFGVAATPAAAAIGAPPNPVGPFPNPHSAANLSELFTADGPRQLFYNQDSTPITPGNVLAGGGLIRQKPDITAADGVATSAPGFNPFFGTSAAAPHAAAIAALVKSANPALTAAQIRTALINSAIDIEAAGVDRNTGAGIVMAYQALQAIGAQPQANLTLGATTVVEAAGDNDGFPEPCERLNYTFRLDNVGGVTATAVSATLTSSTAGVVISPATNAYPNINAGANATNATPFNVVLPCNLACGSIVNFTLTVNYTGGSSPKAFNFSISLGAPGAPVTISYSGPPVPIPDGTGLTGTMPGAPALAVVNVAGVGVILDADLRIDGTTCTTAIGSTTVGIDHTFVNDLEIKLTSPGSTTVLAIDNTDGGGNNFCQTRLDDDTANPSIQTVVTANAPFTGTFKPANALSAFDGQNANGNWTLSAQDFFGADTGNIRAFSLILTPVVCQTAPCSVVCPSDVAVMVSPSANNAVVTYAQPTVTGGCGIVTCTPPSGSTFNLGVTTVTCSTQTASSCSFRVGVTRGSYNLSDPLSCTGPGNSVTGSANINNPTGIAQNASASIVLPAGLVALPGSCSTNIGSCSVLNASTVNWSGTIPAGQTATITYQAQVADNVVAGTQLCSTLTGGFTGTPPATIQACLTANCPSVGPGTIFPTSSEASDQKAGSLLVYNVYTSSTDPTKQNTRINITNIHPTRPAFVHLFFVAEGCAVADSYICLTASQTASFLASDLDPGTTGYLVAVAVDGVRGCPTSFNYLIGDEYVKFNTGHAANLGAIAFSQLAGGLPTCDGNSVTAAINFDGISYNRTPAVLALDNVGSRADGNDTLLILNRIGGNLGIGAASLGTLFGIFYDDAENALSFSVTGGCQLRSSITNNFPRITPRFETFVPAGRTGWLRIYNQTGAIGMTGAAINLNSNAASSAGAFNQGHNLHHLTLNNGMSYVIPVFPPSC